MKNDNSGSIVIDEQHSAVGLVVGGELTPQGFYLSWATPIDYVLSDLTSAMPHKPLLSLLTYPG